MAAMVCTPAADGKLAYVAATLSAPLAALDLALQAGG